MSQDDLELLERYKKIGTVSFFKDLSNFFIDLRAVCKKHDYGMDGEGSLDTEEIEVVFKRLKEYEVFGTPDEVEETFERHMEYSDIGTLTELREVLDILQQFFCIGSSSDIEGLKNVGISIPKFSDVGYGEKRFLTKMVDLFREHGKNIDVKLSAFQSLLGRQPYKNSVKRKLQMFLDDMSEDDPNRANVEAVLNELE